MAILEGALRVQVPNSWLLGFGVVAILVHVLGEYMIIWYLDSFGYFMAILEGGILNSYLVFCEIRLAV